LKSALAFLCLLFAVTTPAFADDPVSPQAVFAEANARYLSGDFEGAERLYLQLVDTGIDSGAVFYNLGNACFKLKKLGEAIYWWEKAKTGLPSDPDVRENLDFASLMVIDRIEVPADPYPVRVLYQAVHFFSVSQESALALVLFLCANALLAVSFVVRSRAASSRAFFGAVSIALLFFLVAGSAGWKVYETENRRQGIVIEQKTDVRSGPGNENVTVVTVHEGTRFRVRGEANGWVQISLPNGWSGWLPRTSVRIL
jgi:tetratricopeptide (TPR) repeat protein